ncbi:hypothetical protein EV2_020940 [Malus domestica]
MEKTQMTICSQSSYCRRRLKVWACRRHRWPTSTHFGRDWLPRRRSGRREWWLHCVAEGEPTVGVRENGVSGEGDGGGVVGEENWGL